MRIQTDREDLDEASIMFVIFEFGEGQFEASDGWYLIGCGITWDRFKARVHHVYRKATLGNAR